jgi:hypothetical protein
MKTRKHIHSYYNTRKAYHYYKKVKDILKDMHFTSIIDIGSRKSPVMEHLAASIDKTMLDIEPIPPMHGINLITADFYKWVPDKPYDVVLCLQVLEHLSRPAKFTQKLFQTGKHVIISVPYKWSKGLCKYHVQDPIDEAKLKSWTGRAPDEQYIIRDGGRERIVCVYNKITPLSS